MNVKKVLLWILGIIVAVIVINSILVSLGITEEDNPSPQAIAPTDLTAQVGSSGGSGGGTSGSTSGGDYRLPTPTPPPATNSGRNTGDRFRITPTVSHGMPALKIVISF
jgi:hypothetical protein